jgi:hypothetical protein
MIETNSNLTTNLNFLTPTSFKLIIDNKKFANIEYFITSVTLPSIETDEIQANWNGFSIFMPGGTVNHGTLSVKFMVDESMRNYTEIFNWIVDNNVASDPIKHDIILSILSSKNNTNRQFRFIDAFPLSIGGFDLNTQISDVEYASTETTFRYTRFEILR